jgi:hypothetical protein
MSLESTSGAAIPEFPSLFNLNIYENENWQNYLLIFSQQSVRSSLIAMHQVLAVFGIN